RSKKEDQDQTVQPTYFSPPPISPPKPNIKLYPTSLHWQDLVFLPPGQEELTKLTNWEGHHVPIKSEKQKRRPRPDSPTNIFFSTSHITPKTQHQTISNVIALARLGLLATRPRRAHKANKLGRTSCPN
ncbi:hypothetical protein ACHAXA_000167, partial [Cyclostephanos tholiformis]